MKHGFRFMLELSPEQAEVVGEQVLEQAKIVYGKEYGEYDSFHFQVYVVVDGGEGEELTEDLTEIE